MNQIRIKLFFILFFIFQISFSQGIVGKWKTIDDQTGKEKSIVEIFEKNGKIFGRVLEILDPVGKNKKCEQCEGEDKNKSIQGLVIIKGLIKEEEEYTDGKILDPKNGKLYKCSISLENKDKLKVRGYIGFSLIGRTQYWYRVKS
ncbi:DUF2147 domain-containing protein [Flavobacterium sp.]|uniref:DUF2147 domain-containing protein n=1 Tax=Flavobacterium sp. TaxID=239 RepID=UPI0038D0C0F3